VDDFKQLMVSMVPFMAAIMLRQMEIAILRDLLGRDPTEMELAYYENQVWLRDLNRWWQDKQSSYQKIHDFVWGSN